MFMGLPGNSGWTGELRELGQDCAVFGGGDSLDAFLKNFCRLAVRFEASDVVHQGLVVTVRKQLELSKKIGTNDRRRHVGDDKFPVKITA